MPPAQPLGTSVRRGFLRRMILCLMILALVLPDVGALAATEHHGQVTFGGLPVPGATVTATKGNKTVIAITDQQGVYSFPDLDDGMWKFQVEMLEFVTQTQEITLAADSPSPVWELKLLPLDEITRGATTAPPPSSAAGTAAAQPAAKAGGFQRAAVNSSSNAPPPPPPPASDTSTTANEASAATGLLVNGSTNNGAASSFAQTAAFGNNRRGPGSLYNGGVGAIFDTSAWDAAPFSLSGVPTSKPGYNNLQIVSQLGGPLGLPHHLIAQSNFFVAYEHQANDDSQVLPGRVPTMLERSGNLSQTLNAAGTPVQFVNPATGLPFTGDIPISPQTQALLNEYPLPNLPGTGAYNYQAPVLSTSVQNRVQSRISKNKGRNQFFGNFGYAGTTAKSTDLFGFTDLTTSSGVNAVANWSRFFRPGGTTYLVIHFAYAFNRLGTDVTPYFANRTNVSGNAEISGNDQDPVNWGPPNLIFSSGIAGLSEPAYARNASQTQTITYDTLWYRGRHSIQFGGDIRLQNFDIFSQQNARGAFGFTGAATAEMSGGVAVPGTGSDLADFLLGTPDTVQISFGNSDKYLRGLGFDAFVNDDWRVNSGLTVNVGLRWEFAQPLTEAQNRLANLDIATGFGEAATVTASAPTGAITGQTYPNSLLQPDYRGIEPRLGLAWRPRLSSPLVVRAGYGIYDNTSVYQVVAQQLATQPPFTKTLSLQNSATDPLTLANAFNATPSGIGSTFAVDPHFRIGYAQEWTVSVQEDLPLSMVLTATYLGIKGTRLMQESLPNTYPLGATNPCVTTSIGSCPVGFIYLTSNGNSEREAGTIQLRRRLSNGITATLQYTYSQAEDDASAFSAAGLTTGASSGGATVTSAPSIAQNWLNLTAERGPSNFNQPNVLTASAQYTSGEGIRGGALLSGWKGRVLKEWTFVPTLTYASGLPETPIYLTNVTGTGITGTIRPNLTGASVTAAPAGLFLNPAAYTAPAPSQWGDAGRNSITGPAQFSLNASLGRTFRLGPRLTGDWRLDASNVLNHVTYTSYNTVVTSPEFGLPIAANTMRQLLMTFRVRF